MRDKGRCPDLRLESLRSLSRFLAMPGREKLQLFKSWLLIATIRMSLWTLRYKRSCAWLRRLQQPRPTRHRLPALRLARSVDLASHLFPGARHCLTRGLCLHTLLLRRGIPSELRFGVRRSDSGTLEAHAWVTSGGEVLIGGGDELAGYAELRGATDQLPW